MLRFTILLLALFMTAGLLAQPVTVGATLPALSFVDQHGKSSSLTADTRVIVFSADKKASSLANEYFNKQGQAWMDARSLWYLADISGMPKLITKLFAMPKMKKFSFPVALARDDAQVAGLPRETGKVTVLLLEALGVRKVGFAGNASELTALIPE